MKDDSPAMSILVAIPIAIGILMVIFTTKSIGIW